MHFLNYLKAALISEPHHIKNTNDQRERSNNYTPENAWFTPQNKFIRNHHAITPPHIPSQLSQLPSLPSLPFDRHPSQIPQSSTRLSHHPPTSQNNS